MTYVELYIKNNLSERLIDVGFPTELVERVSHKALSHKCIRIDYALEFLYEKGVFVSIDHSFFDKKRKGVCYDFILLNGHSKDEHIWKKVQHDTLDETLVEAVEVGCTYLEISGNNSQVGCERIKDNTVSFKIASLLKELGMPQDVSKCAYDGIGRKVYNVGKADMGKVCCAPTQIQAMRYLYRRDGVLFTIKPCVGKDRYNCPCSGYDWLISTPDNLFLAYHRWHFEITLLGSIERAMEAYLCEKPFNLNKRKKKKGKKAKKKMKEDNVQVVYVPAKPKYGKKHISKDPHIRSFESRYDWNDYDLLYR